MKIPTVWTPKERIAIATRLLHILQADIPAGNYSKIGRPNVQTVLYILHESAEVLNLYSTSLAEVLAK